LQSIPNFAKLEAREESKEGRLPPIARGKENQKMVLIFSKTVCPFFAQTISSVGHLLGGYNFKTISSFERTFYKRLHALPAFLSVSVRVLFMSLSANSWCRSS
jgi:hypothetical protein